MRADRADEPAFDLVTGTPPYLPPGTSRASRRAQCASCRIEQRGGIEDYCAAAARLLAPGGAFVACAAVGQAGRVAAGAAAARLSVVASRDVVPRDGKPALVAVHAMRRVTAAPARAPRDVGAHGARVVPGPGDGGSASSGAGWASSGAGWASSGAGWASSGAGSAPLVVRDAAGIWTPEFRSLRAAMGMP